MSLLLRLIILSLLLSACFGDDSQQNENSLAISGENALNISVIWHSDDIDEKLNITTQGLTIADNQRHLFLAADNSVYAIDKKSGETLWQQEISAAYQTSELAYKKEGLVNYLFGVDNSPKTGEYDVSISAGPSANEQFVAIGGSRGEIVLLDAKTGALNKQTALSSSILTPPVIDNNKLIVKSIDSSITALSLNDMKAIWQHQQSKPTLNIQGISPIVKYNDFFISGFDNGKLVFLDENGALVHEKRIAIAKGRTSLERIVDIDAKPIIDGDLVYTVSYQGKATAINLDNYKTAWLIDFSSLLGGDIINEILFLINDKGDIVGLSKRSGNELWRQDKLQLTISTPAIAHNNFIVVGDDLGYLYWLDSSNGTLAARYKITDEKIRQLKSIDNVIYVLDEYNHLFAVNVS